MIHIEKEIGTGTETVYAYHFPSQYVHNSNYPIKIGHAKSKFLKRIKEQQAAMQECPLVDIRIKCDHSFSLEKIIHSRLNECKLDMFGDEWFLTSPEKILEIWWDIQEAKNLSLGEQLRFFREAQGMTQAELAKASDMRQATVSNVETNPDSVMFKTIETVAKELGLRIVLTPD